MSNPKKKIIDHEKRRGSTTRRRWAREARAIRAAKSEERKRVAGRKRPAGNFCLHVPEGVRITKTSNWDPYQEDED